MDLPINLLSSCEADTESAGEKMASIARPGDVVGLVGLLGAGKTVFVRGVVRSLGGDPRAVRSPTFTLMNIYKGHNPIYHFDLYRLKSDADLESIGFFEFARGDGVTLVEWADKSPAVLAEAQWLVSLEPTDNPLVRRITIERNER